MIVRKDKYAETNSLFPNIDWYNEGNHVIDETLEENQELITKIKANAPYMDLVIVDGKIVDIIPTERPEPDLSVSESTFEELQTEQNVDFDYRLSLLEMGLI